MQRDTCLANDVMVYKLKTQLHTEGGSTSESQPETTVDKGHTVCTTVFHESTTLFHGCFNFTYAFFPKNKHTYTCIYMRITCTVRCTNTNTNTYTNTNTFWHKFSTTLFFLSLSLSLGKSISRNHGKVHHLKINEHQKTA